MWAYNKCIPISALRRQYPGTPDMALRLAKWEFAKECGVVLAKAVNVSVEKDPRQHAYILTAELITEPQEADMATMGGYNAGRWITASTSTMSGDLVYYGKPPKKMKLPKDLPKKPVVVGSFRRDLEREINEWLKI